ncbi:MAG: DUF4491 family protein [Muribaculaceae bacterium]|nr:DUF4491 family protein [Muribaculaceae bacterium]
MLQFGSVTFGGLILGLCTFLIIGLFHPLVIKGEYYFGQKCKVWFLIVGILFLIGSLFSSNIMISSLLGVTAFSCFWSIREITDQRKRVEKGWFPKNPKRKYN